jgi:hypothetical protein
MTLAGYLDVLALRMNPRALHRPRCRTLRTAATFPRAVAR